MNLPFESRSLFGSRLIEDETPFMRRVVEDFYYTTIAPLGEEFIALLFQEKENFVEWFIEILGKFPDDPDIAVLPEIDFNTEKVKKIGTNTYQRWLILYGIRLMKILEQ